VSRPNLSEIRLFKCGRLAAKFAIEMPDCDADQIIRLLHQSRRDINKSLRDAYPEVFALQGRLYHHSSRFVVAVRAVFEA